MAKTQEQPVVEKEVAPKKSEKKEYIFAVGRRKAAVARIRLYPSKKDLFADIKSEHNMFVNSKPIETYFSGKVLQVAYLAPFTVTNTLNKFTATIRVVGGGAQTQLEAMILGISRALNALDSEKYRASLKAKGFLTTDARVRQRRKVGMGGKSRRKKQSPKR